jgi:hypothetical protein
LRLESLRGQARRILYCLRPSFVGSGATQTLESVARTEVATTTDSNGIPTESEEAA